MFFWQFLLAGFLLLLIYLESSLPLLLILELFSVFLLLWACFLLGGHGFLLVISLVVLSAVIGIVCLIFSIRRFGSEALSVFLSSSLIEMSYLSSEQNFCWWFWLQY